MRSFEFIQFNNQKKYENALLPEYSSKFAASADFFCAEDIVIPSIINNFFTIIKRSHVYRKNKIDIKDFIKPTIIHTGIKASMNENEVLFLYNRKNNPKNFGLILSNSVSVIDNDYNNNLNNDNEIIFAFYNIFPWDITIKAGDKIGKGFFQEILHPEEGLRIRT